MKWLILISVFLTSVLASAQEQAKLCLVADFLKTYHECWLDNPSITTLAERDRRCEGGPEIEALSSKYLPLVGENFELDAYVWQEERNAGSRINVLFGQMALHCEDAEEIDRQRTGANPGSTNSDSAFVEEMNQLSECVLPIVNETLRNWNCN